MKALADRIGSTEGQAWTLVIGFVLGVSMLAIGVPPLLDDDAPAGAADTAAPTIDGAGDDGFLAPPTTPPPTAPTTTVSPTIGPNRSPSAFNPPAPTTTAPPTTTAAPAPAPTTTTTSTSTSTTTTAPVPLTVRDVSWTSASGDDPSVPDGAAPVGATLGQEDKRSYLRLSGTESVLVLPVADAGNRLAEQAAVRACRILDAGWSVAPGSSPDAGPAVDLDACVDGSAVGDGTWQFDLGFLPASARTDDAGIALVAGGGGPTFQITYAP